VTGDELLARMLASLELTEAGDGVLRGPRVHEAPGQPVFGGELLAQAIVAAARAVPGKRVKSVQAIFARGGDSSAPLDIRVEAMHEGRNLASATVTFTQADRLCTRALVLLDAAEADLVRHQPDPPALLAPDERAAAPHDAAAPETIIVGGVDVRDPDAVGPATLQLWVRYRPVPAGDPNLARALLAFATDGWLIGTAMRPHAGVGQALAHRTISTGVLSHALVFHDDLDANEWHLLDHESVFAGGGRCYGRADVFSASGRLVASFTQEALLRDIPAARRPAAGERVAL